MVLLPKPGRSPGSSQSPKHVAEIRERVADRAHVPIQDGDEAGRIVGRDDRVVELEVVVDQAGRSRDGRPGAKEVDQIRRVGPVVRSRHLPALGPAP